MTVTTEQVEAGQAVYTQRTLSMYDFIVLAVSNRFIWKCPTQRLVEHYNMHITSNHLDVGVGTGYFLDRCRFPSPEPRVALMDLNPETLAFASQRIARYRPEIYQCNVLEPIPFEGRPFDSVGLNYLLHCLPGSMVSKSVVFEHLVNGTNPGTTVFGATLLQGGAKRSWWARRLMGIYNKKGIFSNEQDDFKGLERSLKTHLRDVTVEVVGCAALFMGRT